MSEFTEQLNTGQQSINRYDTSKIFLFNNRFEKGTYTNGTGSEVTLPAGTLMGRISATGKLTPLASGAADGSQFPVGILNQDVTVANGESVDVFICVAGDVDAAKIVFDGSDTLDTVVTSRRLRDRIASDTVGIKLVETTELTGFDNE